MSGVFSMEQTSLLVALACLTLVIVMLGIANIVLLRRRPDGSADDWQTQKASIEVELAVERDRASRLPLVLQELGDVRAARERADLELASLREAKVRLDAECERRAEETQRLTEANEAAQRQLSVLTAEMATLRETLSQERRQSEEKLALLGAAKESMTKEFQVLANDVMSKHGEAFTKQNKEQIDVLLTPLRDKLKDFQDGLNKAHEETGIERALLVQQIKNLSEKSAQMSTETLNLTRALKGSAQMQGAWGEMILETLLEKSGLREGEEYLRQSSHSTDEGDRLRTDVIVNLPGGQHVIIDSKVSTVAFAAYVNAESDEERAEHLGAHLGSMRNHIKTLSAKEYHAATGGGLDYVIMFVPIEGALAAALERDPNLTSYAVQNNVAIATPTTLMIALRTIENVWKVERRNQNAEAIADRAGHLYGKFAGFVEDMQDIGKRLGHAQSSYTKAMGKLQTGPGNLIGQAEKLRELGAKTSKSLPKGMLIDEGLTAVAIEAISDSLEAVAVAETDVDRLDAESSR
jgi:DNA recombination protein RmuC